MTNQSKIAFLSIRSLQDLADYLEIPIRTLTYFSFSGNDFYTDFSIPKSNGDRPRVISAPRGGLKSIQKKLASALSEIYEPLSCVHGFTANRSIASNAIQHVKKRAILRIDLQDFFPSISSKRIYGLLIKPPFEFPNKVASALVKLTCHNEMLPQGSPASPILSNMICLRMDKTLLNYARKQKLKYTRYADDLTFSSTTKFAINKIAKLDDDGEISIDDRICGIIESNGFHINREKTVIQYRGSRQVVTGIVVNEKCNFRRKDYRYLRGLFYRWKRVGCEKAARMYIENEWGHRYIGRFFDEDGVFQESMFLNHVHGLLSYYSMIAKSNNRHSSSLQKLWTSFHDLTGLAVPEMIPERSIVRLDSSSTFRLPGCKTSESYGRVGTGFKLSDNTLITARHCIKNPMQNTCNAIYDSDSYVNVCNEMANADIELGSFSDSFLLDCARCKAPNPLSLLPGLEPHFECHLQEGEKVIAYGYADGKHQLRKIEATIVDILEDEYIVDRAFINGMSGGPVLNRRGNVIGVVTKGSSDGSYDRDGRFVLLEKVLDVVKPPLYYDPRSSI